MKHLRFALVASASLMGIAYAQDEEQRRAPPVEIPDFSNLDEYIYEPKSTFTIGIRHISGAKTSFAAKGGKIASPFNPGEDATSVIARTYQDGNVQLDSRGTGAVDTNGNPIINPDTGFQTPVPNDGRTNSWNYTDLSQLSRPGLIAFHDYSATILPTATAAQKDSDSSMGVDLVVHRDMGKLFGRFPWTLTGGMSISDISANTQSAMRAEIDTVTDYYRYYTQSGGRLPDPPYSAPSSTTETSLGPDGNPLLNTDGSAVTRTIDTTVLLDNKPIYRDPNGKTINDTMVTNRWKLKGAYYTFRAGPTLWIPITTRLKASVSAGVAVAFAGSSYTVTEVLTPEVGTELAETETSDDYKLLPGYYADATLQFDLTERAGFYAGAIYQSTGDYTQTIENATSSYSTKIDLSKQSGVRAGMTFRF